MNYSELIQESTTQLRALEKQQRTSKLKDRVRFLRYLKEGSATTQTQAGSLIGLQQRQSQNLWRIYKQDGIQTLLTTRYQGTVGKLSYYQISALRAYLKTDQAASLLQVQTWLKHSFDVDYTLGGISMLFKRLKIKHKTGRPTNVRQKADERNFFKKTLPN